MIWILLALFVVFPIVALIITGIWFACGGPVPASDPVQKLGGINPVLICPHCQQKGGVRIKAVSLKKGVSGGKATAAVVTAGFSLLATGLSRKESLTEAYCCNCSSTWHF